MMTSKVQILTLHYGYFRAKIIPTCSVCVGGCWWLFLWLRLFYWGHYVPGIRTISMDVPGHVFLAYSRSNIHLQVERQGNSPPNCWLDEFYFAYYRSRKFGTFLSDIPFLKNMALTIAIVENNNKG